MIIVLDACNIFRLKSIRIIDVNDFVSILEHFHVVAQPLFIRVVHRARAGFIFLCSLLCMSAMHEHFIQNVNAFRAIDFVVFGTIVLALTLGPFVTLGE